jgi:DNA-binding MarR family transcriptional regulator
VTERDKLLVDLGQNLRHILRGVWLKHGDSAHCAFSPAQDQLLLAIGSDSEPVNVKQLAGLLGITPGAVTQQVEGLEKLGALSRMVNKEDRREVMVGLTRKGRSSLKQIRKLNLRLLDEAFGNLNGFELKALVELTAKATDNDSNQGKA